MNVKKIKNAVREAAVNGAVVGAFVYGSMITTGVDVSMIEALRPAIGLGLLRFASYMKEDLEFIEMGEMADRIPGQQNKDQLHWGKFV